MSLKSVYNKLDNLETGISAAMVGTTAERLETVVTTMGGALPPLLPGYRIKILDGNHLAATEHRIKELRTIRAGALPGQALVVLDPSLMLVTDVVLCEDGHAQERSLLGQILEIVRAKDVWIDDRNFCTTGFLFGIARREAFFVVRQHAATLHWEFTGKKRACGRIETGKVFEQTVRLTNPDTGEILFARRITVVLDKPTRDGDGEIHILTNLPKKAARARATASKIPVILAVLDGNLVYSCNVYYWHSFNNHPNYGCKSLEYSQNFRSITVSGLPYLMKKPHFDAVALRPGRRRSQICTASAGPSRPRSKNWRRRSMARSTRWATPRRRCSLSAWRWCRTT